MPSALPVLVVQHEDDCPPALLGHWLVEAGVALDVRRPYAGEPLPDDLTAHAGLVVLGGPMGADDDADHAWLGPTKALLREGVARALPTLGVCLGHQLLASALGGTVTPRPRGRQLGLLETGWLPDAATDPLLGDLTRTPGATRCLHWNDDLVTVLPAGAVPLAHTPAGELQAVRFAARAWGVQPHPEVDQHILTRWAAWDGADTADVIAEVASARAELDASWRPLAGAFARLVAA